MFKFIKRLFTERGYRPDPISSDKIETLLQESRVEAAKRPKPTYAKAPTPRSLTEVKPITPSKSKSPSRSDSDSYTPAYYDPSPSYSSYDSSSYSSSYDSCSSSSYSDSGSSSCSGGGFD